LPVYQSILLSSKHSSEALLQGTNCLEAGDHVLLDDALLDLGDEAQAGFHELFDATPDLFLEKVLSIGQRQWFDVQNSQGLEVLHDSAIFPSFSIFSFLKNTPHFLMRAMVSFLPRV